MNNGFRAFLLIATVIIIGGCDQFGGAGWAGPSDVLKNYFDASVNGRNEEAYTYISAADKEVRNFEEYKAENTKHENPLGSVVKKSISYKVLNISEAGERASASVEITIPDMEVLLRDFMGAAFSSAFSGKDEAEIHRAIAVKYENTELPTVTRKEEFNLRKEDGIWKVFLDWKHKKEKEDKSIAIKNLLSDASELRTANKLPESIEKYKEALTLDGELVTAKDAIDSVEKEINEKAERQEYLKNVHLYELKSGYYKTYSSDRVPGVSFKLKNGGDRTLKKVKATVYFMDGRGTVISEQEFAPIIDSPYAFGENRGPLKANYIWSMGQGKFYKVEAVPTEWKEGAVSARITDIEFAD